MPMKLEMIKKTFKSKKEIYKSKKEKGTKGRTFDNLEKIDLE